MSGQRKRWVPWKMALLLSLSVALAIVVVIFAAAIVNDFSWNLVGRLFASLWPTFLIVVVFVYVIGFLFSWRPAGTVMISLGVVSLILILASGQDSELAEILRSGINEIVDIGYLGVGITTAAFAIAFQAIYERSKLGKDSKE